MTTPDRIWPEFVMCLKKCPLKDVRVLTPPELFVNFGPTPLFQLLEALFGRRGSPKWFKFLPHPKFCSFLGRPLKEVRFYPMLNLGHFWAPLTLLTFQHLNT